MLPAPPRPALPPFFLAQVLLFTVDAEDDRIFRRPHPNESNGDNGTRNSSHSVSIASKVMSPPLTVAVARVRGRNII